MNLVACLLMYGAAVLLIGSLLAPWLYWLAQAVGNVNRGAALLAAHSFNQFVLRSILAAAILGLWPLLKVLKMRSWRSLGLADPRGEWPNAVAGFALGIGSLACVALVVVAAGERHWARDLSISAATRTILAAAASALTVSLIEETLFRGAIFGGLRKALSLPAAITLNSLVYAAVHFFAKPPQLPLLDWASGVAALPRMCRGLADPAQLVPGVLTLAITGSILALAYQRTGSLYFPIGLHAGWILCLKLYRAGTDAHSHTTVWFWGTGKMVDGVLALVVMTLILLVLAATFHPQGRKVCLTLCGKRTAGRNQLA